MASSRGQPNVLEDLARLQGGAASVAHVNKPVEDSPLRWTELQSARHCCDREERADQHRRESAAHVKLHSCLLGLNLRWAQG